MSRKCYGIVIEDAHYCDGSSWNVLYMMSHMLLNAVVFISIRSTHAKQTILTGFTCSSPLSPQLSARTALIGPKIETNLAWSSFQGSIPLVFRQLLKTPNVLHIELNPFTYKECCYYMKKSLKCNTLSDEFLQSVYQVSGGNPFWCKQIATFTVERGIDVFNQSTLKTNSSSNPLHVLIVCRLEHMSVEQQSVIKHASIIGEEFSATLLSKILPSSLRSQLMEMITALVNYGLLYSENEESDTYKFVNQLIHKIIYDLTPPR